MQAVYVLDIKDIAQEYERVVKVLPLCAVDKAKRYKEENDRLRSLGGALLIEAFTAKSPILYNEYGKPYKAEPPYFNISHSGDKVGIFLSDSCEVGFDIQHIKNYNAKLSDYVFVEEEKAGLKDGTDFAVRWAMKEAAAKCVGSGLKSVKSQALKEISAETFIFGTEKLYYKNYIDDKHAISLCSYQKINAKLLRSDCDFLFKTLAKSK